MLTKKHIIKVDNKLMRYQDILFKIKIRNPKEKVNGR